MSTTTSREPVSPSHTVVEAVAAVEDVDPVELEVPLFDVIDPEALDRLVGGAGDGEGDSSLEISFDYYEHEVRVAADGEIRVDGDRVDVEAN